MSFMSRIKQELKGRSPSTASVASLKTRPAMGRTPNESMRADLLKERKNQLMRDRPTRPLSKIDNAIYQAVQKERESNRAQSDAVNRLKGPMGEVKERFRSRLRRRLFDR